MTLLKDSLHFKVNKDADVNFDANKQMQLLLWINAVGVTLVLNDSTRIAPANYPTDLQVGSWYYYLLKDNQIIHGRGVDYFDHYVKKPLVWLDEVYDTKSIDIINEDTGEVTQGTVDILNKEYFSIGCKNKTHVLVKITDKTFDKCFELIDFVNTTVFGTSGMMPINTICSDKYQETKAIGGDFYITPENNI